MNKHHNSCSGYGLDLSHTIYLASAIINAHFQITYQYLASFPGRVGLGTRLTNTIMHAIENFKDAQTHTRYQWHEEMR